MSYIFISYTSFDRPIAEALATALREQSWEVWFDQGIEAGKNWRATVEKRLKGANCVVVLWSQHSVKSDWVLAEADFAKKHDILVPAALDKTEPPMGLNYVQCIDLRGWQGGPSRSLHDASSIITGLMARPAVVREYTDEDESSPRAFADGLWYSIAGPFAGIQALHVVASVAGRPGTGMFALLEAMALNAFNPSGSRWNPFGRNFLGRRTRIRARHAVFGSRKHRLELRWVGAQLFYGELRKHEYYLQIRSRLDYGHTEYRGPVEIAYSVKSLWEADRLS